MSFNSLQSQFDNWKIYSIKDLEHVKDVIDLAFSMKFQGSDNADSNCSGDVTLLCLLRAHEALIRQKLQQKNLTDDLRRHLINSQKLLVQIAKLPDVGWAAKFRRAAQLVTKHLAKSAPVYTGYSHFEDEELGEVTFLLNNSSTTLFEATKVSESITKNSAVDENPEFKTPENLLSPQGPPGLPHETIKLPLPFTGGGRIDTDIQRQAEAQYILVQFVKAVKWHSKMLLFKCFVHWRRRFECAQTEKLSVHIKDVAGDFYKHSIRVRYFHKFAEAAFYKQRKMQRLLLVLAVVYRRLKLLRLKAAYRQWKEAAKERKEVRLKQIVLVANYRKFAYRKHFSSWKQALAFATARKQLQATIRRHLIFNTFNRWNSGAVSSRNSRMVEPICRQKMAFRSIQNTWRQWSLAFKLAKIEKTLRNTLLVRPKFEQWRSNYRKRLAAKAFLKANLQRSVFATWLDLFRLQKEQQRTKRLAYSYSKAKIKKDAFRFWLGSARQQSKARKLSIRAKEFHSMNSRKEYFHVWRLGLLLRSYIVQNRATACPPFLKLWTAKLENVRKFKTSAINHDLNRSFRYIYPLFRAWQARLAHFRTAEKKVASKRQLSSVKKCLKTMRRKYALYSAYAASATQHFEKPFFSSWKQKILESKSKRQRLAVDSLSQKIKVGILKQCFTLWTNRISALRILEATQVSKQQYHKHKATFRLFQIWKDRWNRKQQCVFLADTAQKLCVERNIWVLWKAKLKKFRAIKQAEALMLEKSYFALRQRCFLDWRLQLRSIEQLYPIVIARLSQTSQNRLQECFSCWKRLCKYKKTEKLYRARAIKQVLLWQRKRQAATLRHAVAKWRFLANERLRQRHSKAVSFNRDYQLHCCFKKWRAFKLSTSSNAVLAHKWRLRTCFNHWRRRCLENRLLHLQATRASMHDSMKSTMKIWFNKARKKPRETLQQANKVFNAEREFLFAKTWAHKSLIRRYFYAWYEQVRQ